MALFDNAPLWERMIIVIVVLLAAFIAIYFLSKTNHKVFETLSKKHKGIHLVFFEGLIKVMIVVAVIFLVIMFLDREASIWRTMLGGTAVMSAVAAFAAQDIIKDILAGLMITLQKPFEIGDRIELADGTTGIVEDITNRHVVLAGIEDLKIIVPNSKVNASSLVNFSYHKSYRSAQFNFAVSYTTDIRLARKVIEESIKQSPYSLPGRKLPGGGAAYGSVYFMNFEDSALILRVLVYYNHNSPTEKVIDDINWRVREALIKNNIEIPYNYINVVSVDKE